MSLPVRFHLDRRAFGRVHFPRPAGKARLPIDAVRKSLQSCLGTRIRMKREGWIFGRRMAVFDFMGARVRLRLSESGDGFLDLGHVDDEVRETLLEYLRHSLDFEGR